MNGNDFFDGKLEDCEVLKSSGERNFIQGLFEVEIILMLLVFVSESVILEDVLLFDDVVRLLVFFLFVGKG